MSCSWIYHRAYAPNDHKSCFFCRVTVRSTRRSPSGQMQRSRGVNTQKISVFLLLLVSGLSKMEQTLNSEKRTWQTIRQTLWSLYEDIDSNPNWPLNNKSENIRKERLQACFPQNLVRLWDSPSSTFRTRQPRRRTPTCDLLIELSKVQDSYQRHFQCNCCFWRHAHGPVSWQNVPSGSLW